MYRSPVDYHRDLKTSVSYNPPYTSATELPEVGRRLTASSAGGYEQGYTNGSYRFLDESEEALAPHSSTFRHSGSDTSHVNGPYSSTTPNSTNPAAGKHYRPPGAAPALPPKPSGFRERTSGSEHAPYTHADESDVYSDYHYQSFPDKPVSSYETKPAPAPPPANFLPPNLPSNIKFESSSRSSDEPFMVSPSHLSPCMLYVKQRGLY